MNKKLQVTKYLFFDTLSAIISWTLFFIYRKVIIEPQLFGTNIPVEFSNRFYAAIIILPLFWLMIYYLSGFYRGIYRRSRLIELGQTVLTTIIGVTLIFFALILDDFIQSYKNYYSLYFTLLGLHLFFTYTFRLFITSRTIHRIHQRKIGFNTLIVGSNQKAFDIFHELSAMKRPSGNIFTGFVPVKAQENYLLSSDLSLLGELIDLPALIDKHQIEEVIVAIESSEHKKLDKIITLLQNRQVIIKGIPDMHDIISGKVKMTNIYSTPLIKLSNGLMPAWQENLKRMFDVLFSIVALLIFLPVIVMIALFIKFTSPGPVIFKQVRIGRYGKSFTIYKFRSMCIDAEKEGPSLSNENDNRITPIGSFLRRTHLDEIPQFYNVIKGEMSVVGPRPERQFFIDQIIAKAPYYSQLHRVRPGITSWGQVKYGYASNLNEMLERLPYDILYLKNSSLYLDFKILIYTIMSCFKGEGK